MPPEPDNQLQTTDDLQFDTAEPTAAVSVPARTCIGCKRPITDTYYAVRGNAICPSCRAALVAPLPGSEAGRVLKAIVTGVGAGLLGAAIWYAIRRFAHLQLGLVAVMVGFMVGNAVRKASGNRGGVGYQVLAVALTYLCVAANWLPDILEIFAGRFHKNAIGLEIVKVTMAVLSLPVLLCKTDPILLLIIGFAFYQAWKLNKPRSLSITGPYQVGPSSAPGVQV